jgi:hypothetical protein
MLLRSFQQRSARSYSFPVDPHNQSEAALG